jgi:hypothetical protein
MLTQQTIEPTQVAGFNQFFDDTPGTRSMHYGVSLDQRAGSRLFFGLSYREQHKETWREGVRLDFDNNRLVSELTEFDERLRYTRGYAYWAPTEMLALAAEYYRESFNEIGVAPEVRQNATTERIPLTASLFLPNGLSGSVTATHVEQRLIPDPGSNPGEFDTSRFWNLDVGLSWRLPKRRGDVSFNVLNLLDNDFRYQEPDFNRPLFIPDRTFALRASLKFD